jgi:type VI secretion system protein ImpC
MKDAEAAVKELATRSSALGALAEAVSLAIRIEPQLLRALRLAVVPTADAGDEADLWFSSIVETRTPSAITLDVDAARLLRRQLAANPGRLQAAWRTIERVHRDISPVLFAEEQLAYLALAGEQEEARTLLRSAVATLIAPERRGIAPWATSAFARMPDEARELDEAHMLAFGASLRVSNATAVDEQTSHERTAEWAAWLSPVDIPREAFGVTLLERGVEIGPPGGAKSHRIEIPRTSPMLVHVAWQVDDQMHEARVPLRPGTVCFVDTEKAVPAVEIHTLLGEVARLVATKKRVRAPRVRITYEVETGGALEQMELPFVVGVLADLSGASQSLPPLKDRKFIEINADNFDAVVAAMGPTVRISATAQIRDLPIAKHQTELRFQRMVDFDPDSVVAQAQPFFAEVARQISKAAGNVGARTDETLREQTLSGVVDDILHHDDFQRLEATWRGLHYLVTRTETGSMLKIKVLDVSKADLFRDLKSAESVSQSALFKKVYEEEFGVFGGTPFGVLVGDYYFDKSPEDVELLESISNVAATAHAPFIAAAAPAMFGLDEYAGIAEVIDVASVFKNEASRRWNDFRGTDSSRYTALCLPNILLRHAHPKAPISLVDADGFDYEEHVDTSDRTQSLWGNAAWALAARITSAFNMYGWCAAIRGVESGGLVDDLPGQTDARSRPDVTPHGIVDVVLSDRKEHEIAGLGFSPIVQLHDGTAAFIKVVSVMRPAIYTEDDPTGSARVAAQLPYVLAVTRFAHYLKVIMRDKIGGFMSPVEVQTFLNNWIANYVMSLNDAPIEQKARRPLYSARVDIESPRADEPQRLRALVYLQPHFQLDPPPVPIRIVVELPQPAA